ncbi:hypothetical protein EON71_00685 [bacterium]|nr:MAG: hypothetical protein EON71_00685 [bacterium]
MSLTVPKKVTKTKTVSDHVPFIERRRKLYRKNEDSLAIRFDPYTRKCDQTNEDITLQENISMYAYKVY